ncbi:MAG: efflux RND transporter periplasmic adaptor subunit [Candidatus Omnitrophica bacterium]|nr:efflux RND transporter periplasmic adaptor subunit [Candidatus Omnitrophota bacterium]
MANKHRRNIIIICFIIAVIFIVKGLLTKKAPKEIPPRPVETALAIQKDVSIYIESFGNLYSPNNVDIKSQVTGAIKEVRFIEGQDVKRGDLLFIIDPASYNAALDKARAALMEDLANLKLAKVTFDRNKKLFEKQLISKQDFDKYQADLASSEAKVRLDYAEIELEKINLDYCYIGSPVDGVTGKRFVDLGNIVSANTGPTLVNVKTIDTLYVDFTIPERYLFSMRKSLAEGKLKVEVYFDENPDQTYAGEVELLDNTVDNNTGTILLRAIIDNAKRALWAGQFVRVHLILGEYKDAVLVPYEAVQLGLKGSYLFMVDAQNKAQLRYVKTAGRQKEYIVILDGVKTGERVVTSGQLGLSPDVLVAEVSTGEK